MKKTPKKAPRKARKATKKAAAIRVTAPKVSPFATVSVTPPAPPAPPKRRGRRRVSKGAVQPIEPKVSLLALYSKREAEKRCLNCGTPLGVSGICVGTCRVSEQAAAMTEFIQLKEAAALAATRQPKRRGR